MFGICFGYVLDMFQTCFGGWQQHPEMTPGQSGSNQRALTKISNYSVCQHMHFGEHVFCMFSSGFATIWLLLGCPADVVADSVGAVCDD